MSGIHGVYGWRRGVLSLVALALLLFLPLTLAAQEKAPLETKITPKEASELFASVDEITAFISHETGFPVRGKVKRAIISREQVSAMMKHNLKEESSEEKQRSAHSTETMVKLGLLPRSYSVEKGAEEMESEGLNGFYDMKSKTINMLDWLPLEAQRPVLAHELTHSLQDQSFDLQRWNLHMDWQQRKKLSFAEEIAYEEAVEARRAVLEGQGNMVLMEYLIAPSGQSVQDSPQLYAVMKRHMYNGGKESSAFSNAPVLMREELIFPYTYGMDFVMRVMMHSGTEAAYSGLFKNPPVNTRQIMEPQTYLRGEKLSPLKPADYNTLLGPEWERYDDGGLGEFDLRILLLQWGGKDAASDLTQNWRGGHYVAFKKKDAPKAPLAVAMILRFDTTEAAQHFDAIYRAYLPNRCQNLKPSGDGYQNAEGLVQSEVSGNLWLTTESFDPATAALLHSSMIAAGR